MRIAQSEKYQGDDWWEWAIWIDASPDELSEIESVTYNLHPTFRNPVRKVTDRKTNFRLEAEGWGTFTISSEVVKRDGVAKKLRHKLQLHYPETEKKAPAFIRLADPTAPTSSGQANSLMRAILDGAPEANVIPLRTASSKESLSSRITELSVDLTGPAVAALSKTVGSWLTRNSDVTLELVIGDNKVKTITVDNIAAVLRSAVTTLRK